MLKCVWNSLQTSYSSNMPLRLTRKQSQEGKPACCASVYFSMHLRWVALPLYFHSLYSKLDTLTNGILKGKEKKYQVGKTTGLFPKLPTNIYLISILQIIILIVVTNLSYRIRKFKEEINRHLLRLSSQKCRFVLKHFSVSDLIQSFPTSSSTVLLLLLEEILVLLLLLAADVETFSAPFGPLRTHLTTP